MATLTYVYGDRTAVLGPLATFAEPHSYDLCGNHADTLSAPLGWEIVRLRSDSGRGPSEDDLCALANSVREAGRSVASGPSDPTSSLDVGRRGHLRIVEPGRAD